MEEGTITIGTRLSTNKFERDLNKLDGQIKRAEKEKEIKLNAKIVAEDNLKRQRQDIFELEQQYEKASSSLEKLQELQSKQQSGASLTPQEFMQLSDLAEISNQEATIGKQLDNAYDKQQKLSSQVETTALAYEKATAKVTDLKTKAESINLAKQQADVNKIKDGFGQVGSSIQNATRQAGRMILSIFGIRSAIAFLRSASSTLSQYDQQYATNLEYIRFVLAEAIAPVLKWIVNLAATLLNYIYYILNAWFGIGKKIDVSAKSFNKIKNASSGVAKSTKGTTKAVKELKKQLAGFDEMNVLQDNSSSSNPENSGVGSGGVAGGIPNLDIGQDIQVPKWIQWIADNKDIVIAGIMGIAAALMVLKATSKGLLSLGIGVAVAGIVLLIKDIITFIKDPSWSNFSKILRDIGIILVGLAIAVGGFPGLIMAIIGIIAILASAVIKHWNEIKEALSTVGSWIMNNIILPVRTFFTSLFTAIKNGVVNTWNGVITIISVIANWIYTHIIQPIINFFSSLWTSLKNGVINTWNEIISIISGVVNWIYTHIIQPIINFFSGLWNGLRNGASNTWGAIKNVFSNVGSFFVGIWNTIKYVFTGIGQKIGNAVGGAFRGAVNAVLATIEKVLNTPIRAVNKLLGVVNSIPGVSIGYVSTFRLPRMKTGGIANIPNKGVNIGSAIVGESGPEGILPLTDLNTMEILGENIGKHVTINLDITNTMSGRVVSRILKEIKADDDFAFNN